jgi:protein TonB
MFEVLLGSRVRRQAGPGRGLLAAAVHGLLIFGAIRASSGSAPPSIVSRLDTTPVVFFEPAPATPVPSQPTGGDGFVARPAIALPDPPVTIPTGLPPIPDQPAWDPARLRAVLGGPGPSGPVAGNPPTGAAVLEASETDEPAAAVRQPAPRYPAAPREAGIEGRVLVRFIIDTTGHVERGSLRVAESTNPAFDAAAVEAIERSLFRPARVRGRVVRQLTLQGVAFRIARE